MVAPTRDIEAQVGEPLVELQDVTVKFGGLTALDSVTFTIKRGEILGLIGPNGAGKTTCFNLLNGQIAADSGSAEFEGRSLIGLRPRQIWRLAWDARSRSPPLSHP
jgi:ABC-type branched-subunit amino acid transport system ATPase component